MKLANILLKMDQIGSSVSLKHVTPAQVMFLIADHHRNAGGDPILKLEEVADDAEAPAIARLERELAETEETYSKLDEQQVTPEVREKRASYLLGRVSSLRDQIQDLKSLVARRNFNPAQERARLVGLYGAKRVGKFYPGAVPSLPQTFEEARNQGLGLSVEQERLLTSEAA